MDRFAHHPVARFARHSMEPVMVFLLLTIGLIGAIFLPYYALGQEQEQEQGKGQDPQEVLKFHHQSSGPKVDYQALLEAASPLSENREGQDLLQACLAAYGGSEKLAKLQGLRLTYSLAGSSDPAKGSTSKSFQLGRRYKVVQDGRERILNGGDCWVQDKDQTWKMDDFRYRAELFSYLVLAMPYAAETEHFDQVRFSRDQEQGLGLFYFVKTDSLMIIMGVDTSDHLVKATTGVLPNGENTMVFVNKFDDFRAVDGFLFPHKLTNYSLGMMMGENVLEKAEVNPVFPATEFLPRPEGK